MSQLSEWQSCLNDLHCVTRTKAARQGAPQSTHRESTHTHHQNIPQHRPTHLCTRTRPCRSQIHTGPHTRNHAQLPPRFVLCGHSARRSAHMMYITMAEQGQVVCSMLFQPPRIRQLIICYVQAGRLNDARCFEGIEPEKVCSSRLELCLRE